MTPTTETQLLRSLKWLMKTRHEMHVSRRPAAFQIKRDLDEASYWVAHALGLVLKDQSDGKATP